MISELWYHSVLSFLYLIVRTSGFGYHIRILISQGLYRICYLNFGSTGPVSGPYRKIGTINMLWYQHFQYHRALSVFVLEFVFRSSIWFCLQYWSYYIAKHIAIPMLQCQYHLLDFRKFSKNTLISVPVLEFWFHSLCDISFKYFQVIFWFFHMFWLWFKTIGAYFLT